MSKLKSIISNIEGDFFKLKPVKEFPVKTGINRKRWGLLVRGEKEPTLKEAQLISSILNVNITELLD